MSRFNWIWTKITKLVLISVLLLILCSSSDQSEIRRNRNLKIGRRRHIRDAEDDPRCKPPLVSDYNEVECLLPIGSPCKEKKECPLNADCVGSKCVCVDKATAHEDNLSCEFDYMSDLTLIDGVPRSKSKSGQNNKKESGQELKGAGTIVPEEERKGPGGAGNSSGIVAGILTWSSVKIWIVTFGIIMGRFFC